jgi:hypothetical protein
MPDPPLGKKGGAGGDLIVAGLKSPSTPPFLKGEVG